ncbi:hypothetical protein B296_00023842 [Ensete ventricosum]|uniref:Uncharacterized protein n=1 Tax=Ensete ventricosum TaxID=4639 RepID=A0A426Z3Z8_ENSVE|nr:hypothetical protein B296_00023842 [Ensete ventricosum]
MAITTTTKAADNRSSIGRPSVAEEPAVLSLDNGRKCTRSNDERKLQALARPLDPSVDDRGRLNLLQTRADRRKEWTQTWGAGSDDGIDRLRSQGRGFRRAVHLGGTSEAPSLDLLVFLARS